MPHPRPDLPDSEKSDRGTDGKPAQPRITPVATLKNNPNGEYLMKRTLLAALIAGMSVTLVAPMAMADRGDGPRGHGARIDAMDTNDDGQITLEEAQGAFAARFATLDADGNGTLSQSELVADAQARSAERATERFAALDTDGDGELTQAEMPGPRGDRVARMFDRLDTNDDDVLSAEELEAAKTMHGKPRGKDGRH